MHRDAQLVILGLVSGEAFVIFIVLLWVFEGFCGLFA